MHCFKKERIMHRTKATIEYYQRILDKLITILILVVVGGSISTLLSYYSKPDTVKLILLVCGITLSIIFSVVTVKIHKSIMGLIYKL